MSVSVISDHLAVVVWKVEPDDEFDYNHEYLHEVFGPFDSWTEAETYGNKLNVPQGYRFSVQVLRNPEIRRAFEFD